MLSDVVSSAAQTTLLRGLYEELCMTRGYLEAIAERMGGGMKASQELQFVTPPVTLRLFLISVPAQQLSSAENRLCDSAVASAGIPPPEGAGPAARAAAAGAAGAAPQAVRGAPRPARVLPAGGRGHEQRVCLFMRSGCPTPMQSTQALLYHSVCLGL